MNRPPLRHAHFVLAALAAFSSACGSTTSTASTSSTAVTTAQADVAPASATNAVDDSQAPVSPVEGPFTSVAGDRIRFGRDDLEATLPPRTRLGTEDVYGMLEVYELDDEPQATPAFQIYEYDHCIVQVRVADTLLRSPPAIFDEARQSATLARWGATLVRSADPSVVMVRRATDEGGPVLLQRDRFALSLSVTTRPFRAENLDDDTTNDVLDESTQTAAETTCRNRAETWLATLVSTLRPTDAARALAPPPTTVRVPGPDGRPYEVRVPDAHDVAVHDWYHGVEVEFRPRTFYGDETCASVLIATSNSPTGFEPPDVAVSALPAFGRSVALADLDAESPSSCPRRVGVVPAGRRGVEWVITLVGDGMNLRPILEALAGATRTPTSRGDRGAARRARGTRRP